MKNINYQQIYEEELSDTTKQTADKEGRFFELAHHDRILVEELIDCGYRRAIEDALDPEVLNETAALAGEMGTQLYHFANLIQAYLSPTSEDEE
jgi:hypothetical protein